MSSFSPLGLPVVNIIRISLVQLNKTNEPQSIVISIFKMIVNTHYFTHYLFVACLVTVKTCVSTYNFKNKNNINTLSIAQK